MSDSKDETPEEERRRKEPESLRLRNLSVSVTADDLERSMKFYVDGLGFTVKERWEHDGELKGVDLLAGNVTLGLSQDDWAKGRDRKKGQGLRLFAETAQDLDELSQRFRDNGIEVDGPKEEWGMRLVTVVDPDGFKLTLVQR